MATTLLLDRTTWDLVADASGNIAVASEPYSAVQDVASAVRVFQGECWYDTSLGLPYLANILGRTQSAPVFRSDVEDAAKTVPLVVDAKCILTNISANRKLSGQISITLSDGSRVTVNL